MLKKILIAVVISLSVVTCFVIQKPKVVTISKTDIALELINTERAKRKLKPLTLNKTLNAAAISHAEEMAKANNLSHTQGGNLTYRLGKFSYSWSVCAENIAFNQKDMNEAMIDWMNSSGHKRNILNPDITELGVGVAFSKKKEPYYCTIFGKPAK